MPSTARDNYLSTQVKTAPPQKLQWLLVDAALGSANRAGEHWRQGRDDLAILALVHAQSVVGQMLASHRPPGRRRTGRQRFGGLRIHLPLAGKGRAAAATRRVWPGPSASWRSSARPGGSCASGSPRSRPGLFPPSPSPRSCRPSIWTWATSAAGSRWKLETQLDRQGRGVTIGQ